MAKRKHIVLLFGLILVTAILYKTHVFKIPITEETARKIAIEKMGNSNKYQVISSDSEMKGNNWLWLIYLKDLDNTSVHRGWQISINAFTGKVVGVEVTGDDTP